MYHYKAELIKIVDGDTVDLAVDLGFSITVKERFRLYGVDAPETRTLDLKEKAAGLAAKQRLSELLEGKQILVTTYVNKGKYGRYLAEIFTDAQVQSLNQILLDEGHAKPYIP